MSIIATFQALKICLLLVGLFLRESKSSLTWSLSSQFLHWTPYTGPSFFTNDEFSYPKFFPWLSALSVQIVGYLSISVNSSLFLLYLISANLLSSSEPSRNQISSDTTPFQASFFVVTAGNPSLKSNLSWCPNEEIVPTLVLSSRFSPFS